MFKELIMKKALQSRLGDIPQEQQDKILKAFEKDPALFVRIAEEIKAKSGNGGDQMTVAMEVLKNRQQEIAKLIE